jgi:hypothetical protein
VCAVGLCQRGGRAELARVLAEQAAGMPTSLADLAALIPVDAHRQDGLRGLLAEVDADEAVGAAFTAARKRSVWWQQPREPIPVELRELAGAFEAHALVWKDLCGRGPVVIGTGGVLAKRLASGVNPMAIQESDFMVLRTSMDAMAARALIEQDSIPALRDLDQLVAAQRHPACLIDAFSGIAAERERDRVYVALAWQDAFSSRSCTHGWQSLMTPLRWWLTDSAENGASSTPTPLNSTGWVDGTSSEVGHRHFHLARRSASSASGKLTTRRT